MESKKEPIRRSPDSSTENPKVRRKVTPTDRLQPPPRKKDESKK